MKYLNRYPLAPFIVLCIAALVAGVFGSTPNAEATEQEKCYDNVVQHKINKETRERTGNTSEWSDWTDWPGSDPLWDDGRARSGHHGGYHDHPTRFDRDYRYVIVGQRTIKKEVPCPTTTTSSTTTSTTSTSVASTTIPASTTTQPATSTTDQSTTTSAPSTTVVDSSTSSTAPPVDGSSTTSSVPVSSQPSTTEPPSDTTTPDPTTTSPANVTLPITGPSDTDPSMFIATLLLAAGGLTVLLTRRSDVASS